MNNLISLGKVPFFQSAIWYPLILLILIVPSIGQAQEPEPPCCKCEKTLWKLKVKIDGEIKTYNVFQENPGYDEGEFPPREKLSQYTFGLEGPIINLDEAPSIVEITASLSEKQIWYQEECIAPAGNIVLEDEETDFKLSNLSRKSSESENKTTTTTINKNKYIHTGVYEVKYEGVNGAYWEIKPAVSIESKDPKYYSALCYMPIKVLILWPAARPLEAPKTVSKQILPQEELIITPYGTGNTSGVVMDLEVSNPADQSILLFIEPSIVPATGKYQGYAITDEIIVNVQPGATITLPVPGWCYDIHSGAVPAGEKISPLDTWYSISDIGPSIQPGFLPSEGSAFEVAKDHPGIEHLGGVPVGGTYCTYIGTDSIFEYTIDIKKNAEEAAPLLLESILNITSVYDSLYDAGYIQTPFSADPVKEKTSNIQNVYWLYTSILDDNPYTIDDFKGKLIDQYEATSGDSYKDAPEAVQEELEEGTRQFWTTFNIIGEHAKILKSYDSTITTNAPSEFAGYCNIPGLGVLSVTEADVCDAMGGVYFDNEEDANAYDGPTRDTFPVGLKKVTTSLGKSDQITIGGEVSGQIDSIDRIIIRVSNEVETEMKVKVDPETGKFKVVISGVHDGEYKISVEAVMKGKQASYGLTHGRIIVLTDEETKNKGSIISINGQTVKMVDIDENENVIVEFAGNQHSLKKGASLDVEQGIITVSEVDPETDTVTFEIKKKKCCGEILVEEEESIPYSEYAQEGLSNEEKEKLGLSGYKGVVFPPHIAKDVPETVIAIIPFTALPPFGYRCLSHFWLFNQQSDRFADYICESIQTFLIQDVNKHNESLLQDEQNRSVTAAERLQLVKVFNEWSLPPDRFEQCTKGNLANLDYVIDGEIGFHCCPLPEDREGVRPYFEAFIVDARDETGKKLDSVSYYSPSCFDPNDPAIWEKIDIQAELFRKKVNTMARDFISRL